MKAIALINARAGAGAAPATWRALLASEPRLAGVEAIAAGSAQEAAELLDRRIADGVDTVLVFGGDGSVQLAGHRILDAGAGERVALGIVPSGTGSDLARNLGIPREPTAALARALDGELRALDAIRLTTGDGRRRWVFNVASAGISGEVDLLVNALPRKGRTGYLRATLKALRRYRNVPCRVEADGEPWYEGPLLLLAVANSRTFGDGMKVAPGALLDDGLADLVLVGDLPRWQIPLRLPQIYLGNHLGSRHTLHRRARTVRLVPGEPLPAIDLDGEIFRDLAGEAVFEMVPRVLRVRV